MYRTALLALVLLAGQSGGAAAEQEKSAEEIGRELSNPTAALGTLSGSLDFQGWDGNLPGAGDQNSLAYVFQPTLAFPQGNGYNLLFRPAISLLFQTPVPNSGGGFNNEGVELGNTGFDLAYGKTSETSLLYLFGVVGELPTNTDDSVGADQWLLGPEVAIGVAKEWGTVGVLITHMWDVAGDAAPNTSITGGQYFYAFSLPRAFQIAAAPTWSYDRNAASGEKLTLPLGIGLSKTTITAKGTPLSFAIEYWHFVESPDSFGPDWQLSFNFTPVIELPWGK
jgi:hypothetical protein